MCMAKKVSVLLMAALLAGCHSVPVSDEDVRRPPDRKIIAPAMLEPRPGAFPVMIKRDREYKIAGCAARVFIDTEPVVDLGAGQGVIVYLEPGQRAIAAKLCPEIGGGGTAELRADIGEGKHSSFRISAIDGTFPDIQPTAF